MQNREVYGYTLSGLGLLDFVFFLAISGSNPESFYIIGAALGAIAIVAGLSIAQQDTDVL